MIKDDKVICDGCGKMLDWIYVDGYSFGDRMMEDVRFKVKLANGKFECLEVEDDAKPYMVQFDWNHWKKECEDFCRRNDIAECPKCGDQEVDVWLNP